MSSSHKLFRVRELFDVRSGDCHAINELDEGIIPLISCGDVNNGLVGYFEVPAEWQYSRAMTVAYNGSWPLTTKYHPYVFGAKDDVAVLVPVGKMSDAVMLYIAASLNRMVWRYSYGRKCFKDKLNEVSISLPIIASGSKIDETLIGKMFSETFERVKKQSHTSIDTLFQNAAE